MINIGRWNYYVLRYAVGSILGAFILFLLYQSYTECNPFNIHTLSQLQSETAFIFLLGGFAYCYIASAPIFVFHVLRTLHHETKVLRFFPIIQIVPVCIALFSDSDFDKVRETYMNIASARANSKCDKSKKNGDAEFIESYREIREHGNAFLIIIYELLLGYLLISVYFPIGFFIIILLWVIPAGLTWGLGTKLELYLANRKINWDDYERPSVR